MSVINYLCIILVTYVQCYRASEAFSDVNAIEKAFKYMERRLDYLEERSKQFDDFKQTTEKQNDIFRNTIANNHETIEENKNTIAQLKHQLENAFTRIAELESKQETQSHMEFNNQPDFKAAEGNRTSLDEVDNSTNTFVNVHVREPCLFSF